jgi:endonuclease III
MAKKATRLEKILNRLEGHYGTQSLFGPTDAYEMVLYRNAGYPQSDERCTKGFEALKKEIGLRTEEILGVPHTKLVDVMRAGGMIPEMRASRLKEIAQIVSREFGGDLHAVLKRPAPEARKALKKFPTISDAGAEKILLFTKTAAVAALPSNCIHVPLRLGFGIERKNWAASYCEAQEAVRAGLPENGDAYRRTYLLLKRHGEELCKSGRPRCEECPVSEECAYYRKMRGDK